MRCCRQKKAGNAGSFPRREPGRALRNTEYMQEYICLTSGPFRASAFLRKACYPPSPSATPPSKGRGLWLFVMQQWRYKRKSRNALASPIYGGGGPLQRWKGAAPAAYKTHRRRRYLPPLNLLSRVDGIRLLCPPLTEPYVRFSRIRLLE